MRRTLALGLGLLAIGSMPVLAADIPAKAPRPAAVAVASTYNWTGLYTASTIGIQWWDINGTYVNFTNNHNTSGSRALFGSHAGYQQQFGNWVLGVEVGYNTGYNPSYTSSNSISAACLGGGAPVADRTCNSRINNFWTAGAKVGWAWDTWMVYVTGGYANGRIDTYTNVTSSGVLTSTTRARHGGWYAGGGFDVFVTKFMWSDVILGVEYQHVDLGAVTHIDDLGVAAAGTNDRRMRATDDIIRAKLTFKYNFGGPVVARY